MEPPAAAHPPPSSERAGALSAATSHSAATSAALSACLLSRNACLAFAPAVAATVLLLGSGPRWTRVVSATLSTGPAVAVWAATTWMLGQTGSHPIVVGSPTEILRRDRRDTASPPLGAIAVLFSVVAALGLVDLRDTLPRRWYLAIAALFLLQPSLRVARHGALGRGPTEPNYRREALASFVPANALLSVDHVGAPPRPVDGRFLVSPP